MASRPRKAVAAPPRRPAKAKQPQSKPAKPDTRTFKREWERGTALVSLFVATGKFFELRPNAENEGRVARVKPANLLFVSEPGRGKTELLDRFRVNRTIEFRSDLTVRGLWRMLEHARQGYISHLGATELQKFMQRKEATAANLMGCLSQAMEEGIDVLDVNGKRTKFTPPARLGMIGAITCVTLEKKTEWLREMGFLSRTAVIPWELPFEEISEIMDRISDGEIDLRPVRLNLPDEPIAVTFPKAVSRKLKPYVVDHWPHEMLRVFMRLRQIAMSAAVLDGRDVVCDKDVDFIMEFDEYWQRMITE